MTAVAGTPRETVVSGGDMYDIQRYNYGRKWVYFKNKLVAAIR